MRPRIILPALAAAALVACGNAESLSAADFRQQADAICVEGEQQIDALGEEFTSRLEAGDEAEQQAALEDFTAEAVVLSREALDDLRALEPPEELAGDVDAWLGSFEGSVERLEELDGEQLAELVTSDEDPFAEANRLAQDLGLEECGDGDGDGDDTATGDGEASDGEAGDGEAGDGEAGDGSSDGGSATDGEAGDDATGTAAEAVFVDIEGWTYADPPAGAAETLGQQFADQEIVDSIDARSMTPTDGSSDGAIVFSFALSEGARPFASKFEEGVVSSVESQGGTAEPITLAGQEATFLDATASAGFVGVLWQGPTAAIFAIGPDRAGVEAAAEALIGANT